MRGQRGFSLVEVVVALGLLAGVLLSVAGLFLLGERQVLRGRNQSSALAAGRTILEEIAGWNHEATWERFGLAGNAATYDVDTRVNTFAARWQPDLREALADGAALIRIESCDGSDVAAAEAVRVTVLVSWDERTERREVRLSMVRL